MTLYSCHERGKNCYVKLDQFHVPLLKRTRVNVMPSLAPPSSVQSQRAHGSDCGVTHGFALGGQTRREAELCNERLRLPMAVGGERRMKTKSTWLGTAVHVNRASMVDARLHHRDVRTPDFSVMT